MADPKETPPAPPPEELDDESLDAVVGGALRDASRTAEQSKKSDYQP